MGLFTSACKYIDIVANVKYIVVMSLTDYIEKDLLHRIRSGREMPGKLTLEGLAGHYQVSLTPVRRALKNLTRAGFLVRSGKGGRLAVNAARVGRKGGPALEPPERPGNHYQRVADDLVALSFQGREIFLREHPSARKYGISRTALRQIFERLAGLGILEHVPRKGWRLRPFRYEYLMMFAEAREMLELGAMRLARARLGEEDLCGSMSADGSSGAENEGQPINNALHEYLIGKSGNLFIKDFFDRYRRYCDILHRWEQRDQSASAQSARQHRRIAEALIRRDWAGAERILIEHIHHSQAGIKKLFDGDPLKSRLFGREFRQFIIDMLEGK